MKAIIFDHGGVLTVSPDFHHFCDMYAPKFGADPGRMHEIMMENWLKARVNGIDSKEFWKAIAAYLKADWKQLRADLISYTGFRLDVYELMKSLKARYKLGLLSNQIEDWLEGDIEKYGLREIMDAIVTSYGSRKFKPDKAVYEEVLRKLGEPPGECVFIDDMESNLQPARELGIKTILFKDTEQLKSGLISLGVSW